MYVIINKTKKVRYLLMTHGNDMRLDFFTTDENFPFYIQYGNHEQEMFIHGHEDFSELVIVLGGQATHVVDNENFLFFIKPFLCYGFARALSMALAAILPAPIAEITVAAPVTASPPA